MCVWGSPIIYYYSNNYFIILSLLFLFFFCLPPPPALFLYIHIQVLFILLLIIFFARNKFYFFIHSFIEWCGSYCLHKGFCIRHYRLDTRKHGERTVPFETGELREDHHGCRALSERVVPAWIELDV